MAGPTGTGLTGPANVAPASPAMTPENELSEAALDAIAERVVRKLAADEVDEDGPVGAGGERAVEGGEETDSVAERARAAARDDAMAAAEAARRDLAATEAAVDDAGDGLEATVAASLADLESRVAADLADVDGLGGSFSPDTAAGDGVEFEGVLDDAGRIPVPPEAAAALALSPGDAVRVVVEPADGEHR